MLRDLYLPANAGFQMDSYPKYPADYRYPWGEKKDSEYVLYGDLSLKLALGGTDNPPAQDVPNP